MESVPEPSAIEKCPFSSVSNDGKGQFTACNIGR